MQIHSLHLKLELPSHWSWFMLILKVPFKSNQLQEDTLTGFNLLMIALDSSVVLDSERNQKPLLHFFNSKLMLRICIMPKSKFLEKTKALNLCPMNFRAFVFSKNFDFGIMQILSISFELKKCSKGF